MNDKTVLQPMRCTLVTVFSYFHLYRFSLPLQRDRGVSLLRGWSFDSNTLRLFRASVTDMRLRLRLEHTTGLIECRS